MKINKKIIPFTLALTLCCPVFNSTPVQAAKKAKLPNGPEWINKGSGIYQGDRGRIIWGVGIATWIKNPALLREAADQSATKAVASVLNSYTASLLKRTMSSTTANGQQQEMQNVQSALESFVAQNTRGVEIVDRFLAPDGTMYALAELNMDKLDLINQAIDAGTVEISPADMSDAYNELSEMLTPQNTTATTGSDHPSEAIRTAREEAATQNKKEGKKAAKVRKNKKRPDWVDGQSSAYPNSQYLCGVGIGNDRASAENGSYNAIAKVFEAKITGITQSYQSSLQRTGEDSKEEVAINQVIKVSTSRTLRGVQVREYFQEKKGQTYVLSCLERAPLATELRAEISNLDNKAKENLEHARESDKLGKIKQLDQCLSTLLERSIRNSELRIIDADGIGVAPNLDFNDIEEDLEKAKEKFNIIIAMEGEDSVSLESSIIESLNNQDFQILSSTAAAERGGADFKADMVVRANLRLEDAGMGGPNGQYYMRRGVITVTLENGETGKSVVSFEVSDKQGMASGDEAERRVIRELKKKLAKELEKKLRTYINK